MAEQKKCALYVIRAIGKKDKPYSALVLDLGAYKKYLSFDSGLLSSLLHIPVDDVYSLPMDTPHYIVRW